MTEEVVSIGKDAPSARPRALTSTSSAVVRLSEAKGEALARVPTGIAELDGLLGGGVVAGQVLLLAGPPGIGKSTLMLQAAAGLSGKCKALYVSGEESLSQVGDRARRLGIEKADITLASETDLDSILKTIADVSPGLIVLDSAQTVFRQDLPGSPGSVVQVRECSSELLREAKARGAVLFILGHVTKDGSVAGPKVLEHIVDTVLQFDAEERRMLRILRAEKNRFGPTSEVGLFEMTQKGLKGVENASALFLEESAQKSACGRAVSVTLEGSRPMLVEVQALVVPTRYPLARRMATGLDINRLFTLVAALEKHLHLRLDGHDIFVNIAGGLKVKDPALDLAVCLAIVSSSRERALSHETVFLGEVGLLGGVGRAGVLDRRLREAERAGFGAAIVDARSAKDLPKSGSRTTLKVLGVEDIAAAVSQALPEKGSQ